MLDADLAELYQVPTKAFNQAVKRNPDRFPEDFMFRLSREELNQSQIVTGSQKHRDPRNPPYAFTELCVPIFVDDTVLKSSKLTANVSDKVNNEELRKWLEGLNDEDLGRYKM